MSEPEHEPTQELIPGLERPAQGPVPGPEQEPGLEGEPGLGAEPGVGDLLGLLSSPLDDDDLTAVLTRRPRAKLPSMTLALAAIVVLSAGFLVGAMVGKHYGNSGSSSLAAEFRGLAARAGASASPSAGASGGAGSGFAGRGGGALGAGNATIGTIKLIDGATVYVQTTAGDIVQVATSAGTKVTVSTTVPVKDLQPGETVIVEGSKNSKGGIAATSISQTTLGAGFGG
jgi:hypothetical protein